MGMKRGQSVRGVGGSPSLLAPGLPAYSRQSGADSALSPMARWIPAGLHDIPVVALQEMKMRPTTNL